MSRKECDLDGKPRVRTRTSPFVSLLSSDPFPVRSFPVREVKTNLRTYRCGMAEDCRAKTERSYSDFGHNQSEWFRCQRRVNFTEAGGSKLFGAEADAYLAFEGAVNGASGSSLH